MNYQSAIFSKYLSHEEMMSLISDEALIKHMLQFEASLAKAQASLGMIPQNISDEIAATIATIRIQPAKLAEGTLQNGVPVIGLLAIIKENLSVDAAKYLHYGATSQDAMDTAQVLIIRDALVLIEKKVDS